VLSSTGHFEAGRQFSLIDLPVYGAGLAEGQGDQHETAAHTHTPQSPGKP
jgi:hypothetical protein